MVKTSHTDGVSYFKVLKFAAGTPPFPAAKNSLQAGLCLV